MARAALAKAGFGEAPVTAGDQAEAGFDYWVSGLPFVGQAANFGNGLIHGQDYYAMKDQEAAVREEMMKNSPLGDGYAGAKSTTVGKGAIEMANAGQSASRMAGGAGAYLHDLFGGLF